MVTAYRIVRAKYAADAFSGEGARLYGGRWNSPGTRVVYTSGSISLATLEMLVHLRNTQIVSSYVIFGVGIPDDLVEHLDRERLPSHWRAYPAPHELAAIGDEWVRRGASPVLEVPSAVIDSESNFLLNPAHALFPRLQIEGPHPHSFDPRLASP